MEENRRLIECELITGERKLIPAEQLTFRPAVYALIVEDGKMLLVNTKSTNKWFFPGGAVEASEKIEEALQREVLEETGIMIKDVKFFHLRESFFYYEPHGKAYHCLNIFYTAIPDRAAVKPAEIHVDPTDEADRCEWVDIASLDLGDMQSFASEVLDKFRKESK